MLLQSQTALEPLLRRDLGWLLSQALDAAAIKGGGTSQPTGILANAAVASLTSAALSSDLGAGKTRDQA